MTIKIETIDVKYKIITIDKSILRSGAVLGTSAMLRNIINTEPLYTR